MEERKIISVSDFISAVDKIIGISLKDPDDYEKTVIVEVRVKKPKPIDNIKVMEYLGSRVSVETGKLPEDLAGLPSDKRSEALKTVYEYESLQISSSVFFVPANKDLSIETDKVFPTMEDVMTKCPTDLFNALREIVGLTKPTITEGEAKK